MRNRTRIEQNAEESVWRGFDSLDLFIKVLWTSACHRPQESEGAVKVASHTLPLQRFITWMDLGLRAKWLVRYVTPTSQALAIRPVRMFPFCSLPSSLNCVVCSQVESVPLGFKDTKLHRLTVNARTTSCSNELHEAWLTCCGSLIELWEDCCYIINLQLPPIVVTLLYPSWESTSRTRPLCQPRSCIPLPVVTPQGSLVSTARHPAPH